MFDVPLCNARLFEEGLSIHTYENILPRANFNHYAELITSLGPRSRRVRVFQTFRILLLFNFFSFRDVFSIDKKGEVREEPQIMGWKYPVCVGSGECFKMSAQSEIGIDAAEHVFQQDGVLRV